MNKNRNIRIKEQMRVVNGSEKSAEACDIALACAFIGNVFQKSNCKELLKIIPAPEFEPSNPEGRSASIV